MEGQPWVTRAADGISSSHMFNTSPSSPAPGPTYAPSDVSIYKVSEDRSNWHPLLLDILRQGRYEGNSKDLWNMRYKHSFLWSLAMRYVKYSMQSYLVIISDLNLWPWWILNTASYDIWLTSLRNTDFTRYFIKGGGAVEGGISECKETPQLKGVQISHPPPPPSIYPTLHFKTCICSDILHRISWEVSWLHLTSHG